MVHITTPSPKTINIARGPMAGKGESVMKNFIVATLRATFYNIEKQIPVAPTNPVNEWDDAVEVQTVVENVVEEFHSLPRHNTMVAMAEARYLAERRAESFKKNVFDVVAYDIEELPTKVVAMYEPQDIKALEARVYADKFALLQDLTYGQEIKIVTERHWTFDPVTGEPTRFSITVAKEGNVNPDCLQEEGTNKWYFIDKDMCLFTGSDKCKKHKQDHRAIWLNKNI